VTRLSAAAGIGANALQELLLGSSGTCVVAELRPEGRRVPDHTIPASQVTPDPLEVSKLAKTISLRGVGHSSSQVIDH
jgi:hypothetical protein